MSQVLAALPSYQRPWGIAKGNFGPAQIETSTKGMKIAVAHVSESLVYRSVMPITTASSKYIIDELAAAAPLATFSTAAAYVAWSAGVASAAGGFSVGGAKVA